MLYLSQGAETQPIMMAALRSNLADWKAYAYSGGILVVSLAGLFIALQLFFPLTWSFGGVVICVGILLDLLRMAYCRVQFRRTPEGIVEWFSQVTQTSVKRRDEEWHSISFEIPFTMMGVYMKCGAYGSLRLFCNGIADMASLWLGSIARLVLFRVRTEREESLLDGYTHAEMQTAKRIAWLMQKACTLGELPGLEEITRLAGKLFVSFQSQHESLGYMLLSALSNASEGDCGKIRVVDVDVEVVSTFWEVIRSLIKRSIELNISEARAIHEVVVILENKVNLIKDREKILSPTLIMQPFAEINRMLAQVQYLSFPGREDVLLDLERLFVQFTE
jgi:hypothetical protein